MTTQMTDRDLNSSTTEQTQVSDSNRDHKKYSEHDTEHDTEHKHNGEHPTEQLESNDNSLYKNSENVEEPSCENNNASHNKSGLHITGFGTNSYSTSTNDAHAKPNAATNETHAKPNTDGNDTHAKPNNGADANDAKDATNIKQNGVKPNNTRKRCAEERLQDAVIKQQEIQTKINHVKAEVDEKNKKQRNRVLTLIGVVVEQCFKDGTFDTPQSINKAWWHSQDSRLQEKDKSAYQAFLYSLK